MKIETTIEVADEDIECLLSCAFEGGSNYWYWNLEPATFPPGRTEADFEYWHLQVPLAPGGSLKFEDQEEPHEAALNPDGMYHLDRDKLFRGLHIMMKDYPRHWSDFIQENTDAYTGDCFLQCCIFGEVLYG